jgi:hypothetical protein
VKVAVPLELFEEAVEVSEDKMGADAFEPVDSADQAERGKRTVFGADHKSVDRVGARWSLDGGQLGDADKAAETLRGFDQAQDALEFGEIGNRRELHASLILREAEDSTKAKKKNP